MRFSDLPIKRKLALLILAANCSALLIAVSGFVSYELITSKKSATEELLALAAVVGENSAAALAFGDMEAARETLEGLRVQETVDAACLFNTRGQLFSDYVRDVSNLQCGLGVAALGFAGDPVGQLRVAWPIDRDGDRLGSIVIVGGRGPLRERLARYALIALGVLFASLWFSLALSRRLQGFVSQPLLDLVQAAKRVTSERSYSLRAHKVGADECGQLVDAFNEMLEEIDRRDRELIAQRDSLEVQVADRTAELRKTNHDLEIEIAERKRAEATIRHELLHDALTRLANRSLLTTSLQQACERSTPNGRPLFALLFLDLDDFKLVNDTLGHATGDLLLREVASRLRAHVRQGDTVARLGGDEFAILLENLEDAQQAREIGQTILSALSKPLMLGGHELVATASLGMVLSSPHSQTPESFLRDADAAMYRAKSLGKAGLVVFDKQMQHTTMEDLRLRTELRQALERGGLHLEYQPIVDLSSGSLSGCEALLRWRRAGGSVPPSRFVALAEETGLIVPIGRWVLREACLQGQKWLQDGTPVHVSVNVSALQFKQPDFVEVVSEILEETGFSPHLLTLEATETLLMENTEVTSARLRRLADLGVRIAIDDFGTGYSSLNYLRRWPIHTLKIDGSFVSAMRSDRVSGEIVAAITSLANALHIDVTAEGIESGYQLEVLSQLGCAAAQGFLLGPPMSPDELTDLLLQPHQGRQGADQALRLISTPEASASGMESPAR